MTVSNFFLKKHASTLQFSTGLDELQGLFFWKKKKKKTPKKRPTPVIKVDITLVARHKTFEGM